MTTSPRPPFLAPECRIDECELCTGPAVIVVGSGGVPAEVIRCDHACHKRRRVLQTPRPPAQANGSHPG